MQILANDSVVPALGPTFAYSRRLRPAIQLLYDPSTAAARLFFDGRQQIEGYRGHSQFLEGYGFFFGASNQVGAARRGEIDYSLAMFEIR